MSPQSAAARTAAARSAPARAATARRTAAARSAAARAVPSRAAAATRAAAARAVPAAVPSPARRQRPARPSAPGRAAPGRAAPGRAARRPGNAGRASEARWVDQARVRGIPLGKAVGSLLQGRVWIGVVAFALIGIVTMQLALLRLNNGVGRALSKAGALERENVALSIAVSEAGSAEAIEAQARARGMAVVAPGSLTFLSGERRGNVGKAARALRSFEVEGGKEGLASGSVGGGYSTASSGETAVAGEFGGAGGAQADSGGG